MLLLIVPKELAPDNRGHCWITTGLGAEGILTDATAAAICRDAVIPFLRNREYGPAVGAGIDRWRRRNTAGGRREGSRCSRGSACAGGGVTVRRNCKKRGRKMVRLDETNDNAKLLAGQVVEEQVGSIDYDVWLCDCGEFTGTPCKKVFTSYTKCQECHRITALAKRRTLRRATHSSSGSAEDRFTWKSCRATWTRQVTLPRLRRGARP